MTTRFVWPIGDMTSPLVGLAEHLRNYGLLGDGNKHGSPDELLLLSGGPIEEGSSLSLLAGPPTMRMVCRQPSRQVQPESNKQGSALSGELDLHQNNSTCDWRIETWRGEGWNHRAYVRQPDLASALRSLSHLATESEASECGISASSLAGLLTYDLAQWSEPIRMKHLPHVGSVIGVLWRCDRWLVHDRSAGRLYLITLADDEWNQSVISEVEKWLNSTDSQTNQTCLPVGNVTSTITDEEHENVVIRVQEAITGGQFYQLNFGRVWQGRIEHPWNVFSTLANSNPSPFSGWLSAPDLNLTLASASPELLMSIDDETVRTRPIKGTRPRGHDVDSDDLLRRELMASRKEVAEHMMLVDLERNDLSQICKVGSVRWHDWRLETHPTVHHMVSEVRGKLRDDRDCWDALASLFPGGSITGCPKSAVVAAIDELEATPRRAWTGSLGFHDANCGKGRWNLLIRTLEAEKEASGSWHAKVQAGGGIVIESEPKTEVEEAKWKAQALLSVAWNRAVSNSPYGGMEVVDIPPLDKRIEALLKMRDSQPLPCIAPAEPRRWKRGEPALGPPAEGVTRLLFVDNLDSFSWNIIHRCAELGAEVVVVEGRGVDVCDDVSEVVTACQPTHIILGPGPGRPHQAPLTEAFAKAAIAGELHSENGEFIPILGLCLGHQALGIAAGWKLQPTPSGAVHGVPDEISFEPDTLFTGLAENERMMRYHSLILVPRDGVLGVTAWDSETHTLPMAIRHRDLPLWGVQFHPESCGSPNGTKVLENFLSVQFSEAGRSVEMPRQSRAIRRD